MQMASRRPSAGTWIIRNGGWEDEIVRNLGRQRHLDGRRQTIRLQNDSADCSIYFNYGRGMAVGDFSAPLRFARNDGEGEVSAVRYRLSAFRLRRAFGNPPSPLRGPLPPDKQWGAREYIGARHPVSFGVGRSNGVRNLAKKLHSPLKRRRGCRPLRENRHNLRRQAAMSLAKKDRRSGLFSYQHSRSSSTGQWSLPRISEWMEAPLMWSFHTLETRK